LMVAFNHSFGDTPMAIGLNQYSHDMERIYNYLTEVSMRFVDGDYKSFDKRFHPTFRKYAYGIFLRGLVEMIAKEMHSFDYMVKHETMSPAQLGMVLIYFHSINFSGCFWTTQINDAVNEAYFRYCFRKRFPLLVYDECIRGVFLGDDHVMAIGTIIEWTPKMIGEDMKQIGQEYTAAEKGAELTDQYKSFHQVMFLGAKPAIVNGAWTGRMKKETLYESVQWTRDCNMSLEQTCQQMIECASQWDKFFF